MSYKAGIVDAITALNDRNGSSMIAIRKYMQAKLPKDKKWLNATFLSALKSGVASGDFIRIKNSYKLSPEFKKKQAKAAKPKKAKGKEKKDKEKKVKEKKGSKTRALEKKTAVQGRIRGLVTHTAETNFMENTSNKLLANKGVETRYYNVPSIFAAAVLVVVALIAYRKKRNQKTITQT